MKQINLSYLGNITDEDKIILTKITQWAISSEQKFIQKFSFFLDERQVALCESILNSIKFDNYLFFGGYSSSNRKVVGIFSEYNLIEFDEFPIVPVTFSYRKNDILTHRDFLGAIMAQNISRECVGDIIISQGKAVVFLYKTIAEYVVQNITKIGRIGVKYSLEFDENIIPIQEFEELKGTVASLRIDCVLSLALKQSREKISSLIKTNGVFVNHLPIYSVGFLVSKGDEFSIKGYGKFRLDEIGGLSKSERVHIIIKKYI